MNSTQPTLTAEFICQGVTQHPETRDQVWVRLEREEGKYTYPFVIPAPRRVRPGEVQFVVGDTYRLTITHDETPKMQDAPVPDAFEHDVDTVRRLLASILTSDRTDDWKSDIVDDWLHRDVPALLGRKPMDVIREGGVQEVLAILHGLGEGIHV